MNGYHSSVPRAIFGLAAVTMTALTLTGLVFLPAEIDASELGTVSRVVTAASAGASTIAASSDLDSVRKAVSAMVSCTTVKPGHGQKS